MAVGMQVGNTLAALLDVNITATPRAVITGAPTETIDTQTPLDITISGTDVNFYKYRISGGAYSAEIPVATKITQTVDGSGNQVLDVLGCTGTPLDLCQPESDPTSAIIPLPSGGSTYVPACGNFVLDAGEECDDANLIDGDGCSSTCQIETVLLAPENCVGTPNTDVITWDFGITSGTSDHVGFRVKDGSTVLTETTDPNTLSADETGLASNTTYSGRSIVSYEGTDESTTASCPNVTTLMPDPVDAPETTVTTTTIQVDTPSSLVINNIAQGSSGVFFELYANNGGTLTLVSDSGWISNTSFIFTGLTPGQDYAVQYKLRNTNAVETSFSPAANIATDTVTGTLVLTNAISTVYANQAEVNEQITVTASYENTTGETAGNVVFTEVLDAGVDYVDSSFTSSDPSMQFNYEDSTRTITVTDTDIAIGETGNYSYALQVLSPIVGPQIESTFVADFEVSSVAFNSTSNTVVLDAISSFVVVELFEDTDNNGSLDAGEGAATIGTPTVTLYVDEDDDGILDTNVDTAVLSQPVSVGIASYFNLQADNYVVGVTDLLVGYSLGASNNYAIPLGTNSSSTVQLAVNPTFGTLQVDLFNDIDQNGVKDVSENEQGVGTPDISVYRDIDQNGTLDTNVDEFIVTQVASQGSALFSSLGSDDYLINVQNLPQNFYTAATNNYAASVLAGTQSAVELAIQTDNPIVGGEVAFVLGQFIDFATIDLSFVDLNNGDIITVLDIPVDENFANYVTNQLGYSSFAIVMKGLNHLSKVIGTITLIEGETDGITHIVDETFEFIAGDVVADDVINALDLAKLITDYGLAGTITDFTKDGIINAFDLATLIANYLQSGDLTNY